MDDQVKVRQPEKRYSQKSSSKAKMIAVLVLVLAIFGAGIYVGTTVFRSDGKNTETVVFSSVEFDTLSEWTGKTVTQEENSAGVISVLSRQNPDSTVIVRVESADNSKIKVNKAVNTVVETLKSDIKSFELVNKKVVNVSGVETIQLEYRMQENEETKNFKLTIFPLPTRNFYFVYRMDSGEIADIENDINQINKDFVDYLSNDSLVN